MDMNQNQNFQPQQNQSGNMPYQNAQMPQMAPIPARPKAKMLFAVSIIMIVFSVIGLFSAVNSQNATKLIIQQYISLGMDPALADKVNSILPMVAAFSFILALLELISGILGILFSKKPEKSVVIIILGCILTALVIINSLVVSKAISDAFKPFLESLGVDVGASAAMNMSSIIGMIFGLIIPVLYIIAGLKLGKLRENNTY